MLAREVSFFHSRMTIIIGRIGSTRFGCSNSFPPALSCFYISSPGKSPSHEVHYDGHTNESHGYGKRRCVSWGIPRAEKLWANRAANLAVTIGKRDSKGRPSGTRCCLYPPWPHHDIPKFAISTGFRFLSICRQLDQSYHVVEKPPAITVAAYTPPLLGNLYKTA